MAQQNALVQRNLNLLANGKNSADLLLICGNKQWNVHKLIVEGASYGFYEMLARKADARKLVHLQEHPNQMDPVMKFVYTLNYSLYPVASHYTCAKKGRLAKHIVANALANKYSIPPLAAESKAAFEAMKPTLRFNISKLSRRPNFKPSTEAEFNQAWTNMRAVVRAGELIMIWREHLDPCYEAWFVWWLSSFVTFICDWDCPNFCKSLDTTLNPLAKEAGLRRLKNGKWMGNVV